MNADSGGEGRGQHHWSFHTARHGKCAEKVRRKLGGSLQRFHKILYNYAMYFLPMIAKGLVSVGYRVFKMLPRLYNGGINTV